MPRARRIPAYRLHKASGQALVVIRGKSFYLGSWNSPESKAEYDRIISEWLSTGHDRPPSSRAESGQDLTVAEMILAYWHFAQGYYHKDDQPTSEVDTVRQALRPLRKLYGHSPARRFGPLALKAVREEMIHLGWTRTHINRQINRTKRVFRWSAENELVPVAVYQGLMTVDGLRKGRSAAREKPPVGPVPDDRVDATLPHLPPVVADMVRVQRLTGMRPQEVVGMRAGDVDRADPDCWAYRPGRHKSEHHGRERVVFLGPRAREILEPYLLAGGDGPLFSPRRSEARRNAERREDRRVPLWPSHARRRSRERPGRVPGEAYTRDSYRRAIARACDLAFPHPTLAAIPARDLDDGRLAELLAWRKAQRWHPNQLRHSAATRIRKLFGLEASQAILGHAELGVTQVYAERDMDRARDVMRQVG